MKRNLLFLATAAAILLGACTKKDYKDLSKAIITPASPVSDSIPLKGTIKGTMLAGKTYTVAGDVYINAGDTLTLQAGVTVQFTGPYGLGVKGSLLSLGTKDHPNYFTFRSTFEKCGSTGGEAMNAKAGTIGDFAYNLCVGMATNGPKLSNSGAAVGVPGSNVHMYNNTIVNCGYRRQAAGRGGSIDFEEGAGGMAYNNIIVNCKFGLRVVQNPIADTANLRYGYNYTYADSASVANNIYPSMKVSVCITQAMPTDIPLPSSFLPAGWNPGDTYTAPASLLGTNNPQFINGPVPMPAGLNLRDISTVGSYNFRLKTTSPCRNQGN